MKLIARNTDYTIRALCLIAKRRKKIVSVVELVDELEIPKPFLRKILQVLNKKGVLRSYKGRGGGFQLAKAPNQILLTDLIEIFQGPLKLNECFFKKMSCPNKRTCNLKARIDKIEKNVIDELKSISMKDLL